jgi:hypothetical protein
MLSQAVKTHGNVFFGMSSKSRWFQQSLSLLDCLRFTLIVCVHFYHFTYQICDTQ